MTQIAPPDGLCRHPYRALFPLGWLMAWLGLVPWIVFALDIGVEYPRHLHVLVLIQGVLTPFAAGFLFMVLPRRLDSASPRPWQMALVLLVPPVHAVLVWQGVLGAAHLLWAAETLMLAIFAGARIFGYRAQRRGPAAFVWVPIGLSFGFAGALGQSFQEFSGHQLAPAVATFSWLLLTQGMFLCLVFGIGALFLPLVTHKEPSVDADVHPNARIRRLAHEMAAVGILIGFAVEAHGWTSEGRAIRAIIALAVLVVTARIHRLPVIPGTQRKLIWLASWCLPIGLALAAAIPSRPQIGLHVFFLTGIGLITMSVALHVAVAHSTGQELVTKAVWRTRIFGTLVLVALGFRIGAEIDLAHHFHWVAAGALAFLLALIPWGLLVLPRVLPALFRRQA